MQVARDRVIELIQYGQESEWLDFKASMYHKDNQHDLLKDIMSMANSLHSGSRFIIVGVKLFPTGSRELLGIKPEQVDDAQFQQLVLNNLEPDVKFTYYTLAYESKLFGIFEISKETIDRPYMVRKPYGRELRIGDCWIRKGSQQSRAKRHDFDEFYLKQRLM